MAILAESDKSREREGRALALNKPSSLFFRASSEIKPVSATGIFDTFNIRARVIAEFASRPASPLHQRLRQSQNRRRSSRTNLLPPQPSCSSSEADSSSRGCGSTVIAAAFAAASSAASRARRRCLRDRRMSTTES